MFSESVQNEIVQKNYLQNAIIENSHKAIMFKLHLNFYFVRCFFLNFAQPNSTWQFSKRLFGWLQLNSVLSCKVQFILFSCQFNITIYGQCCDLAKNIFQNMFEVGYVVFTLLQKKRQMLSAEMLLLYICAQKNNQKLLTSFLFPIISSL